MPKLFDLLKLYFTNAHLTDEQQTHLIIGLILVLIGANLVTWALEFILQFRLKQKDVGVELQKQRGVRRSEICEQLWIQISEINQILPGENDARTRSISMITAARSYGHAHSLHLSKRLEAIITDLLDHLTIATTDYSQKNNQDYIRLLNAFKKEFRDG